MAGGRMSRGPPRPGAESGGWGPMGRGLRRRWKKRRILGWFWAREGPGGKGAGRREWEGGGGKF